MAQQSVKSVNRGLCERMNEPKLTSLAEGKSGVPEPV